MVEVFKTNVNNAEHADALSALLAARMELWGISFDLEDCDRVLRVAGDTILPDTITQILYEQGFECSVME